MRKKLYEPYLNQIEEVIHMGVPVGIIEKAGSPHISGTPKHLRYNNPDEDPMAEIAQVFGIKSLSKPKLAPHPDFRHLCTNEYMTEEHYIVSVFVDVKNSTNLFRKCTKEQVFLITNIITRASTNTFALFGGNIHRIMFDGMLCFFGGKLIPKEQAVMNAVHAATAFCYFMKNELPLVFAAHELEPVNTRIGLDFGDSNDVLWGLNGSIECGEMSTTSLHTSLASKMQSNAPSNGIILGENMKKLMDSTATLFCDVIRDKNGNVDENKRYIFREPYYTQYFFDWAAYLKTILNKNIVDLPEDRFLINAEHLSQSPFLESNKRLTQLAETTHQMHSGQNVYVNSLGEITKKQTPIRLPPNNFYSDAN